MYSEADLPLNDRGAVYHLDLLPEEIADTIITVGDPGRVKQVSQYFDSIEIVKSHREFLTHTGYLGKKRISVISTGIGMPNIDIVMSELDALANIDFNSRKPHPTPKSLSIVRLGTTGALQAGCSLGSCIISRYAVGFDTLLNYYQHSLSTPLKRFEKAFDAHFMDECPVFYVTAADDVLTEIFTGFANEGITATCTGFYGPQGRHGRLVLQYPDFLNTLSHFQFEGYQVTNLEMETAGILGMGMLLGHRCASLSVVLANRALNTFSQQVDLDVKQLIEKAMPVIEKLEELN